MQRDILETQNIKHIEFMTVGQVQKQRDMIIFAKNVKKKLRKQNSHKITFIVG